MGSKSKIDWLTGRDGKPGASWNTWSGCEPVSEGCAHCYARNMMRRFRGKKGWPDDPNVPQFFPERMDQPLRWTRPRRIFVCSMSDVMHEGIPDESIAEIWEVMRRAKQHTFIVLTKRSRRLRAIMPALPVLPNVCLGVTAENQRRADERIPDLLACDAAMYGVSIEPALGPVVLRPEWLERLSWTIFGAESGRGARPASLD